MMPGPLFQTGMQKREAKMFACGPLAGQRLPGSSKPLLPGPHPVLPPLHHINSKGKPKNPNHVNSAGFEAYLVKCVILPS